MRSPVSQLAGLLAAVAALVGTARGYAAEPGGNAPGGKGAPRPPVPLLQAMGSFLTLSATNISFSNSAPVDRASRSAHDREGFETPAITNLFWATEQAADPAAATLEGRVRRIQRQAMPGLAARTGRRSDPP